MRQRPRAVSQIVALVWAGLVVNGIGALLTNVLHEQVIRAWARGNQAAQELLASGGLAALESSDLVIPGFSAVALTAVVTYAMLVWVLVSFFVSGHAWARWALLASALFTIFVAVVLIAYGLPAAFLAVTVAALLLSLATAVLLLRRDVGAYLHLG